MAKTSASSKANHLFVVLATSLTLQFLLRREGWNVNAKRRVSCRTRVDRPDANHINDFWAMDFMSDELFDGRQIRLLTIVDHFTRESLAIEVGQRMRGKNVVSALERLACNRTLLKSLCVDNGPEFTSKVLDQWAYANGVTLDLSRPVKPTDNASIESFNVIVRAECLNENWFLSLDDATENIEAWRVDYNEHRPHSALGSPAR